MYMYIVLNISRFKEIIVWFRVNNNIILLWDWIFNVKIDGEIEISINFGKSFVVYIGK